MNEQMQVPVYRRHVRHSASQQRYYIRDLPLGSPSTSAVLRNNLYGTQGRVDRVVAHPPTGIVTRSSGRGASSGEKSALIPLKVAPFYPAANRRGGKVSVFTHRAVNAGIE